MSDFRSHLVIAIVSLAFTLPCRAVLVATNPNATNTIGVNTIQPTGLAAWNYVGWVNGGSAVYLGNNWVLTADHVGSGNFNLGSSTYVTNRSVRVTDSLGNPTDLLLLHITTAPALTNLSLIFTTPAAGQSYTNIGFGVDRNTAIKYYDASFAPVTDASTATYAGFGYGSSHDKSYGTNSVYNFGTNAAPQTLTSFNIGYGKVTAFAGEFLDGTDQIVSGDSGGGVFNSFGQLVGINDAMGTYSGQPGSTALFGDGSYMVDIATYYHDIAVVTGVPEPGCCSLVAIGLIALKKRWRAPSF
jgi:hypothetical protein